MTETDQSIQPDVMAALDRYGDTVRRVCTLYLRHHEDVEDVFQDVFLKYLQRMDRFAHAEHEKAWLIRVTINSCKDLVGSFWRKRIVPLDENLTAVIPAESQELMTSVLKLPEKERTVIYLFYYEGYAATEIAVIMNEKVNTVYSHLHRARARLRAYLGGMEDEKSNTESI